MNTLLTCACGKINTQDETRVVHRGSPLEGGEAMLGQQEANKTLGIANSNPGV